MSLCNTAKQSLFIVKLTFETWFGMVWWAPQSGHHDKNHCVVPVKTYGRAAHPGGTLNGGKLSSENCETKPIRTEMLLLQINSTAHENTKNSGDYGKKFNAVYCGNDGGRVKKAANKR